MSQNSLSGKKKNFQVHAGAQKRTNIEVSKPSGTTADFLNFLSLKEKEKEEYDKKMKEKMHKSALEKAELLNNALKNNMQNSKTENSSFTENQESEKPHETSGNIKPEEIANRLKEAIELSERLKGEDFSRSFENSKSVETEKGKSSSKTETLEESQSIPSPLAEQTTSSNQNTTNSSDKSSCSFPISDDLEWRVVYIGSPESTANDQELESVLVGPVALGKSMFVLQAPAPDPSKIPNSDLIGVTAILLSCHYREQEFIRVGYYLKNEYTDPILAETPPETPDCSKITRTIIDEPRITRFQINWNKGEPGSEVQDFPPEPSAEELAEIEKEFDGKDTKGMEEDKST
ncbi:putative Histone chaperone asf1-B [Monocercomonoides exilis]|uniref:putative Histone chaperone asf1-B n=1 Tax=Monocercomonoides exilis TaxID=2049356 RepID=UPI0035594D1F|nr:putative Histone chaperone asf1-B [Monocercomonoides exilis]|eukprot:MONOS_9208.1-p1 / transcript=MONOS_9208.1 / gene=MONOS_9208 / organism=Monocercomonoides_exilis_PA203 / gene_product=Histone chaperone asf1-B / transcript_product=Histone chaperone asf1-B / location=Mono_scaffold00371:42504-44571(-) / protein_length=346 / sequence_SO=supercontig / SO=protein_coding / is_pseudo=false